ARISRFAPVQIPIRWSTTEIERRTDPGIDDHPPAVGGPHSTVGPSPMWSGRPTFGIAGAGTADRAPTESANTEWLETAAGAFRSGWSMARTRTSLGRVAALGGDEARNEPSNAGMFEGDPAGAPPESSEWESREGRRAIDAAQR